VDGPTEAMNKVVQLQNMKTGGKLPEFKSSVRSMVISKTKNSGNSKENATEFDKFISLIYIFQINEKIGANSGFSAYIFDILLDEIGFTKFIQKKMIARLKTIPKLVEVNPDYYYLLK